MKGKLKTIWSFVRNTTSPTIEQKLKYWVGSMPLPTPLHTEIEPSLKLVNNAYNLLRQNAELAASAPMVVPRSGSMQTAKRSHCLALNTKLTDTN